MNFLISLLMDFRRCRLEWICAVCAGAREESPSSILALGQEQGRQSWPGGNDCRLQGARDSDRSWRGLEALPQVDDFTFIFKLSMLITTFKLCRMDQDGSLNISFNEWRDFLLLAPSDNIHDLIKYWRHSTVSVFIHSYLLIKNERLVKIKSSLFVLRSSFRLKINDKINILLKSCWSWWRR